ncbi:hypothetical protein D3C78_1360320 [compost metagenome]
MEIQCRAASRKRIVVFHQGIELTGLQQPVDRQIKLQFRLLLLRRQCRQHDTGIIERSVEQHLHPRQQYRLPMFGKALLLQLLQQPLFIERLGKIERFKQAVQESPWRSTAWKSVRCERWLTVLSLLACGINIQPRQ